MSQLHRYSIHQAISQHGDAWRDYFSFQIDAIEEFHDEQLPGLGRHNPTRIQEELAGSKGIQRELKPRKVGILRPKSRPVASVTTDFKEKDPIYG